MVQSRGHITATYSLVLVIYLLMSLALGRIMRAAEKRASRGLGLEGAR